MAILKSPIPAPPVRAVDPGQIRIASPCSASWEEMKGSDWMRHCTECNLNVYNFSAIGAMTMKSNAKHPCLFLLPFVFLFGLAAVAGLAGCGGSSSRPSDCSVTALSISPLSATADHLAAAPGNKVNFMGFDGAQPAGCSAVGITAAIRQDLKWTVSDTVNATIGNTLNVDYGVATCVNAAPGPVTVTASGPNAKGVTITGTGTLTCK